MWQKNATQRAVTTMREEQVQEPVEEKKATPQDHTPEPAGSEEDPPAPVVWLPPDED